LHQTYPTLTVNLDVLAIKIKNTFFERISKHFEGFNPIINKQEEDPTKPNWLKDEGKFEYLHQ
jgi:hypothetical protein